MNVSQPRLALPKEAFVEPLGLLAKITADVPYCINHFFAVAKWLSSPSRAYSSAAQ